MFSHKRGFLKHGIKDLFRFAETFWIDMATFTCSVVVAYVLTPHIQEAVQAHSKRLFTLHFLVRLLQILTLTFNSFKFYAWANSQISFVFHMCISSFLKAFFFFPKRFSPHQHHFENSMNNI